MQKAAQIVRAKTAVAPKLKDNPELLRALDDLSRRLFDRFSFQGSVKSKDLPRHFEKFFSISLTDSECRYIRQKFDVDGNGRLDEKEFNALIHWVVVEKAG